MLQCHRTMLWKYILYILYSLSFLQLRSCLLFYLGNLFLALLFSSSSFKTAYFKNFMTAVSYLWYFLTGPHSRVCCRYICMYLLQIDFCLESALTFPTSNFGNEKIMYVEKELFLILDLFLFLLPFFFPTPNPFIPSLKPPIPSSLHTLLKHAMKVIKNLHKPYK